MECYIIRVDETAKLPIDGRSGVPEAIRDFPEMVMDVLRTLPQIGYSASGGLGDFPEASITTGEPLDTYAKGVIVRVGQSWGIPVKVEESPYSVN